MPEGAGLSLLVVRLFTHSDVVAVNVYKDHATMPMIEKMELPLTAFPHEPSIGESFTLVVA